MGAWSENPFGDDAACDWGYEFVAEPTAETLMDTFELVLRSDYVDYFDGAAAVAAAEVVAKLRGHGGVSDAYTEEIDNLIASGLQIDTEPLLDSLRRALNKVTGDNSELAELWGEGGDETWANVVADVLRRATLPV